MTKNTRCKREIVDIVDEVFFFPSFGLWILRYFLYSWAILVGFTSFTK